MSPSSCYPACIERRSPLRLGLPGDVVTGPLRRFSIRSLNHHPLTEPGCIWPCAQRYEEFLAALRPCFSGREGFYTRDEPLVRRRRSRIVVILDTVRTNALVAWRGIGGCQGVALRRRIPYHLRP